MQGGGSVYMYAYMHITTTKKIHRTIRKKKQLVVLETYIYSRLSSGDGLPQN